MWSSQWPAKFWIAKYFPQIHANNDQLQIFSIVDYDRGEVCLCEQYKKALGDIYWGGLDYDDIKERWHPITDYYPLNEQEIKDLKSLKRLITKSFSEEPPKSQLSTQRGLQCIDDCY